MTAVEVNYLVRLLSSVYVYFWIPIRLSYLRLKFKLRPVLKVSSEVFAITALIVTGVPLSIIYMIAEGITRIIGLWINGLCNIIEETTGIDGECLIDSVLSSECNPEDLSEIPEKENITDRSTTQGNTNELTIDDTVSGSVGSDDKNEPETTE